MNATKTFKRWLLLGGCIGILILIFAAWFFLDEKDGPFTAGEIVGFTNQIGSLETKISGYYDFGWKSDSLTNDVSAIQVSCKIRNIGKAPFLCPKILYDGLTNGPAQYDMVHLQPGQEALVWEGNLKEMLESPHLGSLYIRWRTAKLAVELHLDKDLTLKTPLRFIFERRVTFL
jgi:hypothetical protein